MGLGIILTINEVKDIIKVIRSFASRGFFLKGTTEKTISKEEALLSNFLGPLIKVGLPLKKNVLTALTKSFPILSGLSVAPPVTDGAIRKKFI